MQFRENNGAYRVAVWSLLPACFLSFLLSACGGGVVRPYAVTLNPPASLAEDAVSEHALDRALALYGEALEQYDRCAAGSKMYTGAMMNLALLCEDRGEYERAIACYRDVLRAEPANNRARLFLGGAIDSTEEVYDEMERKEKEKLDQILRLPVGEFELSVRSRNVLQSMDIMSLGDLVQKTEGEMLAKKNFGETSLREIKQLLAAKGLRLGMGRDQVERRHQRERLALVMSDHDSRVLATSISELDLSVRSRRCMARLNIQTVGDMVTRTEEELLSTKNFGQTSLMEIRQKLGAKGLRLRSAKEEAAKS